MSTLGWVVATFLILSSAGVIVAWRNLRNTIRMIKRKRLIEEVYFLVFAIENSQTVRFRHRGVEYIIKPVGPDTERVK